jgi:isochorismate pyruvate lyase
MGDVRAAIDAIDRDLVATLATRLRYIEAAARIKNDRDAVRDEWRKADVLAKVADAARAHDLPGDLAATLWETLIEYSIAYEFRRFDALRDRRP